MRLRAGYHIRVRCGPRVRAGQVFGLYTHGVEVVWVGYQESHAHFGGDGFGADVGVEPIGLIGFHGDELFRLGQLSIVSAPEKDLRGAHAVGFRDRIEPKVYTDWRMPAPAQTAADKVLSKISVPDQRMF